MGSCMTDSQGPLRRLVGTHSTRGLDGADSGEDDLKVIAREDADENAGTARKADPVATVTEGEGLSRIGRHNAHPFPIPVFPEGVDLPRARTLVSDRNLDFGAASVAVGEWIRLTPRRASA